MCTGLLPPGANPIAVKILIIIIIRETDYRMSLNSQETFTTEDNEANSKSPFLIILLKLC